MNQTPLEFPPLARREIGVVVGVIAFAQFAMFLCVTPVPHHDASQYLEPGILMATEGVLARPCDQYYDLSYKVAFFGYPPGFPIVVAAWVKLFGHTEISLLLFTHLQHVFLLTIIWILARVRFGVSRISAALAILSLFPFHHHGRPDLTSLCFAAMAWLLIPPNGIGIKLPISGILLGFSVLTSLQHGSSSAIVVGLFTFIACNHSIFWRFMRLGTLITTAILTKIVVLSVLISIYDAWVIAYYQLIFHLQVRGGELNVMPSLVNPYAIKFCLIPLVLFTLFPAILAIVFPKTATGAHLKISALCFLFGFFFWFLINKVYLLYIGHFAYLARPIFHATLMSARSHSVRIAGYVCCLVLVITHAYFESRDFVLLLDSPRPAWEICHKLKEKHQIVMTDSVLFLSNYKPFNTISYECYTSANRWMASRDMWPRQLRERYSELFRSGPNQPDIIIMTNGTFDAFGPPDPNLYRRVDDAPPIHRRELFGIRTSYPTDYYHLVIYEKIVNKPQGL
jgi:hypothetical protein